MLPAEIVPSLSMKLPPLAIPTVSVPPVAPSASVRVAPAWMRMLPIVREPSLNVGSTPVSLRMRTCAVEETGGATPPSQLAPVAQSVLAVVPGQM